MAGMAVHRPQLEYHVISKVQPRGRDAKMRDGRVIAASRSVVYIENSPNCVEKRQYSSCMLNMDSSAQCRPVLERSISQAELEFEDFLREEDELQKKRYKPLKAKSTIHSSDYKYKLGTR